MPTGDALEAVGGAEVLSEAVDQKRNSIAVADTHQRAASLAASGVSYEDTPTPEDMVTLRRVPTKIPAKLLTIAFVELCERFSYYGTTVVFTNFIQYPLPEGSNTGADLTQPGGK